jgi:hypothetical protein
MSCRLPSSAPHVLPGNRGLESAVAAPKRLHRHAGGLAPSNAQGHRAPEAPEGNKTGSALRCLADMAKALSGSPVVDIIDTADLRSMARKIEKSGVCAKPALVPTPAAAATPYPPLHLGL